MTYTRKFFTGLILAVASFSLVASLVPASSASANTVPVPNHCTANSPSYWQWNTNRVYTKSQAWCLHLVNNQYGKSDYLTWQSDGNFVYYVNGVPVAKSDTQAGTGSRGFGATMTAQTDGNIVVKDSHGKALWGLNYLSSAWKPGKVGSSFTINLTYSPYNTVRAYSLVHYRIYRAPTTTEIDLLKVK